MRGYGACEFWGTQTRRPGLISPEMWGLVHLEQEDQLRQEIDAHIWHILQHLNPVLLVLNM